MHDFVPDNLESNRGLGLWFVIAAAAYQPLVLTTSFIPYALNADSGL